MAIQLPNPGLGDGQTGDNEFVMWTKVKDNFNDSTHAASRLVGKATGNIPEFTKDGIADTGIGGGIPDLRNKITGEEQDRPSRAYGKGFHVELLDTAKIPSLNSVTGISTWNIVLNAIPYGSTSVSNSRIVITNKGLVTQNESPPNSWSAPCIHYTNRNTTKDSNGFIKASSPVLRVFSDHIEGNGDGEAMGAEFVKKGVGNYLIKGTTGLAEEGWYVTIPQDANGNNLVAVEYESLENGDVVLRTYKRKFDFETVSIVADHDNPLDIPGTRWIDLRFNEIEREVANEPIE